MTPPQTRSQLQPASGLTFVPADAGESWWMITNHQLMKLTADNTAGALSLWFETVPPGGGPPPHVHYGEDEVFIVTEGEITFHSGERHWVGGAGAVVFAPRGIPHHFENTGETVARMIIFVTPGGFDRFFRGVAHHSHDHEKRPPILQEEFNRVLAAAAQYDLEFRLPQPDQNPAPAL